MRAFIPISKPNITEKEISYVNAAVTSTWVSSLGEYIIKFEKDFASFCGVDYAVSVFNGTVAIHLALEALGIGEGDEVIMPNLSFIATANAVLHARAVPVFADIEPDTLCIDANDIERKITGKTKAIMPVHLYGHPANMNSILKIASEHDLLVIEDAAEAHGAKAFGKTVGSFGKCATFSFYGNKIITTGEGGMITTNDQVLDKRLRHLRDHAMLKEKRYWHDTLGFNYRMTNLQAALGCAQLERVGFLLSRRNEILRTYEKHLAGVKRLSLNKHADWAEPSCWLVCMEIQGASEKERDEFMIHLNQAGIDSRPYFFPMSFMPYINMPVDTPVTFEKYKIGLNLPTYIDLSEEEIEYVCSVIKKYL
ncbi:MAG: DegT/DnrJ/EryC1/StrS family aminotransferase [Saprospiraceae bacterium]|uniref:GDP-perosamine synthase n=1 Tax=Candidatus Opimibacter skivensis TaxID=2982028 RepID=A0A9D7XPS7_9BACT|nr:DegT/DnrJ/EryC1/StrS family aminotransferase [Candidatus Opimibacter skivensis]